MCDIDGSSERCTARVAAGGPTHRACFNSGRCSGSRWRPSRRRKEAQPQPPPEEEEELEAGELEEALEAGEREEAGEIRR